MPKKSQKPDPLIAHAAACARRATAKAARQKKIAELSGVPLRSGSERLQHYRF